MSKEITSKNAKKENVIDQKFVLNLILLFDSEDPRERDYLRTILHRLYGKFMSHRAFIRKQVSYQFQKFAFQTERHNGVGELLEILRSIINGFALPLKEEHQRFLRRALIPLHRPKCVSLYHQQLQFCIVLYVEKDPETAIPILNGLINYWPWANASKQIMFLNELEEVLEVVVPNFINDYKKNLFNCIEKSLNSEHFQVVQRTLFLWNNDALVANCFMKTENVEHILKKIYPSFSNNLNHWNTTVKNLATEVLELYKQEHPAIFLKIQEEYNNNIPKINEMKVKRKNFYNMLNA